MPKVNAPLYSLNGGEVGKEALGRLDLERMQYAGALYQNFIPRKAGQMTIRPGLEYITSFNPTGNVTFLSYPFSDKDTIIPVLSDQEMRPLVNDQFVTRESVSTIVQNGDFTSLTGWTDASTGGAKIGILDNKLHLIGDPFGRAAAKQTITVAAGDAGKEHSFLIKVDRGPVRFRLGSTDNETDLFPSGREVVLDDGSHSIAFTPQAGSIYLEIYNEEPREMFVDQCIVGPSGVLAVPTPWTQDILSSIRYRDSLDVLYVSSETLQQREIQKRFTRSWGVQRYKVDNGPFSPNISKTQMKTSGLRGTVEIETDSPYFSPDMSGRLFRIFSAGQLVQDTFSAPNQEGDFIRISGVDASRTFQLTIAGTFVGTVFLQTALDDGSGNPSGWRDYASYSSPIAGPITDPDDNVIKFYRAVTRAGFWTSGTVTVTLDYPGGGRAGTARMLSYDNPKKIFAEVLDRFYGLDFTTNWDYTTWSDADGYPSAVELWGGRLYWFQGNECYGSVPDAFKNFSDEVEDSSAPIQRSLGAGGQTRTAWGMALQRLIVGTNAGEISVRASSFDEPLTAENWFPIEASTKGCANVQALKADSDGFFVQSSGTKVYRITWDAAGQDYVPDDMMELHEEICGGSPIVSMATQRNPDTMFWFVLANGEARVLTYEKRQNVIAWSRFVTDGQIEAVTGVRGAGRDTVYFYVNRNGDRRIEKLAMFDDCKGGAVNCLADSFTRFTLTSPQTTFSVPHLNGRQVLVWVDGKAVHDQGNLYTVANNEVVLQVAATEGVVIGLPYEADWLSTQLAYGAALGTAMGQPKRINRLGFNLVDSMLDGLRAASVVGDIDNGGFDTSQMSSKLKRIATSYKGKPLVPSQLFSEYRANMKTITSEWDTDSRVYLNAQAPYPMTIATMVLQAKTNDTG